MSERSQATKEKIQKKVVDELSAKYVEVIDESWKHAGHAGVASGGGHFILYVASEKFEGVTLINRNRIIFDLLKEEMKEEIHGFTVKAMTPQEWGAKR